MLIELHIKANSMNTDGVINVALFAEAHLYNLSSNITFFENSQMFNALHKLKDMLAEKIKATKEIDVRTWSAKDKNIIL